MRKKSSIESKTDSIETKEKWHLTAVDYITPQLDHGKIIFMPKIIKKYFNDKRGAQDYAASHYLKYYASQKSPKPRPPDYFLVKINTQVLYNYKDIFLTKTRQSEG